MTDPKRECSDRTREKVVTRTCLSSHFDSVPPESLESIRCQVGVKDLIPASAENALLTRTS